MSRLTFISILSIIALLVAMSIEYSETPPPESAKAGQPQTAEPDFFLERANSVEFDESGKIRYRFNADQLQHFPKGDYTLVETPDVTLFHRNGTPWYINAQQGRILPDGNTIKLWDEVLIRRGTPQDPLEMRTRALTILPKQDIAKTEQDVVITNRAGRIDATGMVSYIDENRMELLSNVRVRHAPASIH